VELARKPVLNVTARVGFVTLTGPAEVPALPIVRQLMHTCCMTEPMEHGRQSQALGIREAYM